MAFTQTSRIWWSSSEPGRSTSALNDAVPGTNSDGHTGVTGRKRLERWLICARSGVEFPLSQAAVDPNTNRLVWRRFVDKPDPVTDQGTSGRSVPTRPQADHFGLVRPGDLDE